ncbi:MAG: hypothetical protein J5981_05735 [Lachnospira sp.]|nr:hypothetical protein [Lachnospira sp.]
MRDLFKLLKTSVLILALVVCVYIVGGDYFSDSNEKASTSSQNYINEAVANLGDILATVEKGTVSGGGNDKLSDSVKSDYQPVLGTGQLVENEKATEAPSGAATAYDFPETMYPYRAMLSDTQKEVYDQIYEGVLELKENVSLCRQLDQSSIKNVMNAVFNDHPELFWLEMGYSYGYTSKGTVISVMLKYNETADTLQSSKEKFLSAAGKIINAASVLTTDEEKEKYVYKAIQNMCVYDENAELNQSAYSVFVNGRSVCAGYSRAFQYIMQQLNIPCYFCTGYANGGNHAWNIVYIDGKYYNVDLSWDDSLGDISETISYAYFNLSDKAISVDHTRRELSLKLPECK